MCPPGVVSDVTSAQRYASCNIVVGSLFFSQLPLSLDEDVLFAYFGSIAHVYGNIHVNDNPFLTSLSFLRGAVSVAGVFLSNNPNLVDSRLPLLKSIDSAIVSGCIHLCSTRYPSVLPVASGPGCADLMLVMYFRYGVTPDLGLIGSMLTSVLFGISKGSVCFETSFMSH